jgi:hypothetical protein
MIDDRRVSAVSARCSYQTLLALTTTTTLDTVPSTHFGACQFPIPYDLDGTVYNKQGNFSGFFFPFLYTGK